MAQLKDSLVQGSMRVTDTLYANTINTSILNTDSLNTNENITLTSTSGDSPAIIFDRGSTNTDWKLLVTSGKLSFQSRTGTNAFTERGYFADNSGAFWASTHNGLTLTAATTGFTIAGGTTSKTLTVSDTITLKTGTATYLAYYSAAGTISGHSLAHFADEFGSSVANKKNELVLGNATAKATNGSSWGQIALYSPGTKGTYINSAENSTSWYTATLQAKTGTIALTSDIPTNLNQLTNGPGYVTSSGVTSITLSAGAGIALSATGAITSTGTRTISISGMDTSSGSTTQCLTKKGTWADFTNNAGTVTSVTIKGGTNIDVDNEAAISSSGTRTISLSSVQTPLTAASSTTATTTSPYKPSLWAFNLGVSSSQLTTGMMVTVKIPVATTSYGSYISIDNGTTYKPIVVGTSTARLTTHYSVDDVVTLFYDAAGSCATYAIAGAASTSTVSGGCWRVLNYYDSGNSNDTAGYIRQMQNAAYRKTTTALYRYKLLLPHKDGIQVIPVNTTDIQNNTSHPFSTAMTTITTEEFDITRPIEYYNTTGTINAAGNIDGRYHWSMYSGIDLRYSFNTGTTLTAGKDVYLVATLQAGGLTAKLRNPGATGTNAAATATGANAGPITQTLPTSDDGFIYIKLGNAYSTAAIILTSEHPIYWYKDGGVRPFSPNGSSPSGSASKCLTEQGTWASFTNNAGTVTSITLSAGAGIALSATGAITTSGTRTISISGMNTSTGDTTKFLNQKGEWSTVSTSDTKVTQAYSTTNNSYPLLMSATAGITATTSRGATTSILNNKIYANPSEGSLCATGGIYSGSVYLRGSGYISNTEGGEIELAKATNGSTPGIIDIIYEDGVDKLRLRPEGAAAVYVDLTNKVLYGAAWNDYAEYRRAAESLKPGNVIIDNDDGTVSLATKRLLPGAQIVSDTFGFIEGKTDEAKTPVAVAGRVLVYTYQNRTNYHAGMAVCSAPNGTVDIMTREEIKEYPDCIIGYVSEIPNYETWGSSNVKVDGRIWVRVK